jgi:hypothetical protein
MTDLQSWGGSWKRVLDFHLGRIVLSLLNKNCAEVMMFLFLMLSKPALNDMV